MTADQLTLQSHYDVIIIGGRPSGATLAARLGQQGVNVLLIDRAKFPSLPPVSSPIIYSCTMQLLDEIGAPEADYARNTPKLRTVITEARDFYRGQAHVPEDNGRDYGYAIDRERFDYALWQHAQTFPTVTTFDEFAAIELLWDTSSEEKRVIGIIGKPKGESQRNITADVVVGADGKYSFVARNVDAPMYNQDEGKTTSLFYAYWKNLAPYDIKEPMMLTHGTMDGLGYLLMDSADGATAVVVEGFADTIAGYEGGSAEDHYLRMLQHAPRIWERVKDAVRITTVRGLKGVENYYRHPFGSGWALVGDAAHHKDPLGGQGIYDAVFGARAFAHAYLDFRQGKTTWGAAMQTYQAALESETLPMYRNTLAARQNLEPQGMLQRVLGRYASENPNFMANLMSVPTRMKTPSEIVTPPLLVETVAKGVAGDVRRVMTGAPSPAAIPPLPTQPQTAPFPIRLGMIGWMVALPAIAMIGGLELIRSRRSSSVN